MNIQKWKCRRCNEVVDMVKFRCGCTISPSPWEPVLPEAEGTIGQANDMIDFLKQFSSTGNDDNCPRCHQPIHPCVPCEEVMAFHNDVDSKYFDLVSLILEEGRWTPNRTGIDTIGVFGAQAKFDVNLKSFPILTTKKVFFKAIVHELLWFLKGDTNIKYLVDNNVHIWDEWAYARYKKQFPEKLGVGEGIQLEGDSEKVGGPLLRIFTQDEFIQKIKDDSDFAQKWGELGEGTYGGMWRDFPYALSQLAESEAGDEIVDVVLGGVDQLQKVIDKLKTNPTDRRMIVSAWHPYWVDHCALPPCHCLFHFNTQELTTRERWTIAVGQHNFSTSWGGDQGELLAELDKLNVPKRKLNCLLYQRSVDSFLGMPFNITSYALLTAMVAHVVGMVPGVFTHTYGDLHIYKNHIEQVKLQKTRLPRVLPELWLNPEVKNLFDFKYEDIKLIGYDPHPAIKGEVAV